MSETVETLDALARRHPKFLRKGGLCVGLVVTRTAQDRGLPLDAKDLRTAEGGQVAGLSKGAVQAILEPFGITKVLAEEGGRTSRGSLGLMEAYVRALNALHETGKANLKIALSWWVGKVHAYLASEGPKFEFDVGKSVQANLQNLFAQAAEIQKSGGGTNYVGAMLQHMVGAKLEIVLGREKVPRHGFSVADHSTQRNADFEVDGVAVHVTTAPGEALIRKTATNLKAGLKPVIVTLPEGLRGAEYLLSQTEWASRVDVLDAVQFLSANVYERSLFDAGKCAGTILAILDRYNEIIADCENDPALRVRLPQVKG